MTNFLFQKDAYVKEFDARIVEREGTEVVLDQTAFYYTSGGQPHDTGTFHANGITYEIQDVYRHKPTGKIRHQLNQPIPEEITSGHGKVNWERRYGHMRHHTALHMISRVALDEFQCLVTGSQVYADRGRIDFALEDLSEERLRLLEEKTNEANAKAYPVTIQFLPREEALKNPELIRTQINLVPESATIIRCVEIKGFDFQACGGTHVGNTREIGRIQITKYENKGVGKKRLELTATP
ncbi:alanyl-tRNA editing protein [Candidatus Micrarchaeota archaeon]|nr:alanyl-tRNA editing protein [Candidatus Micrarchaeota archaeon]